jgi:hypothetical protein
VEEFMDKLKVCFFFFLFRLFQLNDDLMITHRICLAKRRKILRQTKSSC